jgi:hypothetical protein
MPKTMARARQKRRVMSFMVWWCVDGKIGSDFGCVREVA